MNSLDLPDNVDLIMDTRVENDLILSIPETDSITSENTLDTDDIVHNLVDNNTDEVIPMKTNFRKNTRDENLDSLVNRDDVSHNFVENYTDSLKADVREGESDGVLDSMLDSIMNNDDILDDTVIVDDSILEPDDADVTKKSSPKTDRLCELPMGRVKTIMKSDPDINIVSAECIFLVSKSCELFLQWLGKEVHTYTVQQKKKTIQKRDLDLAIKEHPALEFLEEALD